MCACVCYATTVTTPKLQQYVGQARGGCVSVEKEEEAEEVERCLSWSARSPSNSNSALRKLCTPRGRMELALSERFVAVIRCVSPRQCVPASFLSLPAHTRG